MELMSGILGLLGGAGDLATGGAAAAAGGIFGVIGSFFTAKQKAKELEKERVHELEVLREERETNKSMYYNEAQIQSMKALRDSSVADLQKKPHSSLFVSAVKELFRPGYTLCLQLSVMYLFYALWHGIQGNACAFTGILTPDEMTNILKYIIYSVVFLNGTAGGWWFCERAISPPAVKYR